MQARVGAVGVPGGEDTDLFACPDPGSSRDGRDDRLVGRAEIGVVVNGDDAPVDYAPGEDDEPVPGREDRRTGGAREIDAPVAWTVRMTRGLERANDFVG